jgi:hypothetical protein
MVLEVREPRLVEEPVHQMAWSHFEVATRLFKSSTSLTGCAPRANAWGLDAFVNRRPLCGMPRPPTVFPVGFRARNSMPRACLAISRGGFEPASQGRRSHVLTKR